MSKDTNFKGQLLEYLQKQGSAQPIFDFEKRGPPHMPEFLCVAKLPAFSIDSRSGWHKAKKSAEQEACCTVLGLIQNISTKQPPLKNFNINVREFSSSENYKGLLQEYCQKVGLPAPTYEYSKFGPDHTPVFSCTAIIVSTNFTGHSKGQYQTKRVAEQRAAWDVLTQIMETKQGRITPSHSERLKEAQSYSHAANNHYTNTPTSDHNPTNIPRPRNFEQHVQPNYNISNYNPQTYYPNPQPPVRTQPSNFTHVPNNTQNQPMQNLPSSHFDYPPKSKFNLEMFTKNEHLLTQPNQNYFPQPGTNSVAAHPVYLSEILPPLIREVQRNEPKLPKLNPEPKQPKLQRDIFQGFQHEGKGTYHTAPELFSHILLHCGPNLAKIHGTMSLVNRYLYKILAEDKFWISIANKTGKTDIIDEWDKIKNNKKEVEEKVTYPELSGAQVIKSQNMGDLYFKEQRRIWATNKLQEALKESRAIWHTRTSSIIKYDVDILKARGGGFMLSQDKAPGFKIKVKCNTYERRSELYAAFEADVEANKKGLKKCLKEGGYEAVRELSAWKGNDFWTSTTDLSDKVYEVMAEGFKGTGGAYLCKFYTDPYESGWTTAAVWVDLVNGKMVELGTQTN
eukprot:TRINITY_DN2457_c0_g1_i1.p1 TRINITY_DN2457_c0_g1~~TRINITY_DN2457_c0_g1_i1.p1  ORF type:complete len:622 (+),score=127.64 TRINITY_DN2457_c0_g1_i1:116-1981(+)